jgi:hypothetical protein
MLGPCHSGLRSCRLSSVALRDPFVLLRQHRCGLILEFFHLLHALFQAHVLAWRNVGLPARPRTTIVHMGRRRLRAWQCGMANLNGSQAIDSLASWLRCTVDAGVPAPPRNAADVAELILQQCTVMGVASRCPARGLPPTSYTGHDTSSTPRTAFSRGASSFLWHTECPDVVPDRASENLNGL